ncbi:hypothetical protein [Bosea caraganae]|nr:hypothetical protein [Bosea caraganae]
MIAVDVDGMQPSQMLKPIYSLQELLPSPKRAAANPVTAADRMVAWAASMDLPAVCETEVLPRQRRRAPAKSAKPAKAVSSSR